MYEITPGLVTIDDILSKVTQKQIWEYYLGFEIEPGVLFKSPLRDEDDPSANLFYAESGDLLLKDFAYKVMNIWQFLQWRFEITFKEVLLKVHTDLCVNQGKLDSGAKPVAASRNRDRTSIEIKLGRWTKEFLAYYEQYSVTKPTLKLFKTLPITGLWVHNEPMRLQGISFSYEFGKGIRKIYSPFADKGRKFISNVPGYMYSGYEQLPWIGELLIITKSHKDVMVWYELGYNAIAPQGEGHSIDPDFIEMLKRRFAKILINYDNDRAGKYHSENLKLLTNFELLYLPQEDDVKDISDYIKKYGKEKTILWLKDIGL